MILHRFCLMAILLISVLASTSVNAGPYWVYRVKTFPLMGNDQALSNALNQLGKERWELVNCTEGNAELTCIFKRPGNDHE